MRNRPEWTDGIIAALDWLGMAPDEGPYFQSQQEASHQVAIEALWANGALVRLRVHAPGDRRSDQGPRRAR